MKKLFYFAAAAVALAACAKNEVIPVNSGENQEITFNVAPKTKATTAFDKNFKFKAWAYYLPGTVKWDKKDGDATTVPATPATTPELYIDGAVISNTNPTGTDGVWKAEGEKTYYWPKNGYLTFFAYSLNKRGLDLNQTGESSGFGCDATVGINGSIDLQTNSNTDFLVADPACDKTCNEDTYTTVSGVKGVPTLFRHQLSWIVFRVKAGKYADKEFKLKSITFKGIYHAATYSQNDGFKPTSVKSDINYTKTEQQVSTVDYADVTVAATDHWLYIPQKFDETSYIEVIYDIYTTVGNNKVKDENVTCKIYLNKGTTPMFTKWEMGKKYTINLTFTLDEIHWDPAVQEWEDVNIGTDAKPIIVG